MNGAAVTWQQFDDSST